MSQFLLPCCSCHVPSRHMVSREIPCVAAGTSSASKTLWLPDCGWRVTLCLSAASFMCVLPKDGTWFSDVADTQVVTRHGHAVPYAVPYAALRRPPRHNPATTPPQPSRSRLTTIPQPPHNRPTTARPRPTTAAHPLRYRLATGIPPAPPKRLTIRRIGKPPAAEREQEVRGNG